MSKKIKEFDKILNVHYVYPVEASYLATNKHTMWYTILFYVQCVYFHEYLIHPSFLYPQATSWSNLFEQNSEPVQT